MAPNQDIVSPPVRQDLLERVVDGLLHDAIVIVDDHKVILFNAAAERLWGLRREEVLGRDEAMLWPEAEPGPFRLPAGAESRRAIGIRRADGNAVRVPLAVASVAVGGRMLPVALLRDAGSGMEGRQDLPWLSLVANKTDRALVLLDEERRIVYANPAFTDMFGYEVPEVIGRVPMDFLASAHVDPEALARARRKALETEGFHEELLARDKQGRDLWVQLTINPIPDADGVVRHIAMVMADITRGKQIETLRRDVLEALTSDMPLRDVAEFLCRRVEAMAPEVVPSIILVDGERKLRALAAPGLPEVFCAALNGSDIGPSQGSCGTAAFRGEPVQVVDIATDPLWARFLDLGLPADLKACWSSPIKRRDGYVIGTFAFYFREKRGPSPWHEQIVGACIHLCMIAIERDNAKQQIAQLSRFDALTGLPNRARFREDFAERTCDGQEGRAALLFLDIDHLKHVNETLGHTAGDKLIVEAGERLRRLFRGEGEVYRFSGDEFLIMLSDGVAEQASASAERALQALADSLDIVGVSLGISATIGISLFPENGSDGDLLVQHAGTALAQAKAMRRGAYRFFSSEMEHLAQERLRLGGALRKAIASGGLELHYQPQIAIGTQEIHGVEALARWTAPQLGAVPPDKFIPLAEEIGQIEAVGVWSLREACRQMAAWRRAGIGIPTVSVNLSASHFRNEGLPEFIAGLLEEHDLPPRCLTVEITESIMLDGGSAALDTVRAVRGLGVGLSMDDFGTGFSSLSNLPRLPITELKIDRSFMRNLDEEANALALMTAVIRIGQSLGLTVVAEGVETQAQYELLASLSCHVAQGYLFSRALPAAELTEWVEAHAPPLSAGRGCERHPAVSARQCPP